jgi:hypothetical protein
MLPPLPLQQPVVAPNSSSSSSSERGGDEIGLPQRRAHAHRGRLLTLALVDRARHGALQEEELDALLKLPDEHHALIEAQQELRIVLCGARDVCR